MGQGVWCGLEHGARCGGVDWWGLHGEVCEVRYVRWGMQGDVHKAGYMR